MVIRLLGILFVGAIFGYKDLINPKLDKNLARIQNICLLFLLFMMGITIGINDEIVKNIFGIGVKAFVIAIFTILFSIVFVRIISKLLFKEDKKVEL